MDSLQLLMGGLAAALQPVNLLFALIGSILGTLVGVLPGLGPAAAIAMLLPVTVVLDPTPAIIMLCSMYYGVMYGGTITSVLVNVPGEPSSAITCLDGYQMAKQGRAGAALAMSAIGSFVAGSVAIMGLVLLALPLSSIAVKFGAPEMFALMVMGLSAVTGLSGKSVTRGLASALLGMTFAMVGMDPAMGAPRFSFGLIELTDGLRIVPVVMGVFGIGEILVNAETGIRQIFETRLSRLIPEKKDVTDSVWPIARATAIGFVIGLVPGIGAVISTIAAYVVERKMSKYPEKFGTGVLEGVVAPETANNSHCVAHFIPLLTLGIPASATLAVLMGALMMNGLMPGPLLFRDHPAFVWTVIASLYVGNVMLLILNLPLIPVWVQLLRIPYSILFAVILAFCVLGAYSLNNSTFDIWMMLLFGLLGYVFKKLDFPPAPLVVTFILGPLMEKGLRGALQMSDGDITILFTRPVSAVLLALALVFLLLSTFKAASALREAVAN